MLARDLAVGGERWSKGRRLTKVDLDLLAAGDVRGFGPGAGPARPVALLVPERGEVHEDDAATSGDGNACKVAITAGDADHGRE